MYQDFNHEAQELSAFANSKGTFTISLKNGQVIHYTPIDEQEFRQWLLNSAIREVNFN